MTTQLPLDRLPVFGCTLGSLQLDSMNVASVSVAMDEYMHDSVQVKLRAFSAAGLAGQAGLPMGVHIGWQNDTSLSIYGYFTHADVRHHRAGESDTVLPEVTLHMLGASSVMQSGSSSAWPTSTTTSVIRQLVNQHQLAYSGDDSDFVWPQLSQITETDWEMVVQLAKQVGYSVVAQNTTIRVFDLTAMLRQADAPQTYMVVGSISTPNVFSFDPRVGTRNIDVEHAQRTTNFLAQDGEVSSHVQDRPAYMGLGAQGTNFAYQRTTGAVAISYGEAQMRNQAETVANMWTMTADLVGQGNTRVQPGTLVNVVCPDAEYSGLWYVRSARHTATMNSYTVALDLGKDAVLTGRIGGQALATYAGQLLPPPPRLVGNKWISAWR